MRQSELTGKAQTVLGIVDPDSLGITLPHEHLLIDMSTYFIEPTEACEKKLAHEPVRLENLGWVTTHFVSNLDNIILTDENLAIKEALLYKWAGGNTIVEMSSIGLARDPLGLARISRATGLNVVMGAGYYVGASYPPGLATKTEEEIAEGIIRDITVGVDNTGIRAGIIGEIGCSTPLEERERKVLRASAVAQRRTGAPLNIHPPRGNDTILEIIKILADAGADLNRTIISHCDASGYSQTTLHRLADAGCYIEFDGFGFPAVPFPAFFCPEGSLIGLPSEVWRINEIKHLIGEGYLNRMLISHDVCLKIKYVTYGGCGYAHILRNVVPWMRRGGLSDDQINTMLIENPKRILSFALIKE